MAAAAAGGVFEAAWRRGDSESDRWPVRGERARGRGVGARRLAWTEAEGAGLQDLGAGNEMRSTGCRVALMMASVRA